MTAFEVVCLVLTTVFTFHAIVLSAATLFRVRQIERDAYTSPKPWYVRYAAWLDRLVPDKDRS